MVESFLSEEEELIAEISNVHLTEDRVIKLVEGNGDRDYKDIQLDNIVSFQHSKHFNKTLAIIGGLITVLGPVSMSRGTPQQISAALAILGLIIVVYAYAGSSKKYLIRGDTGVEINLPSSNTVKEFWKEVNKQMNH